MSLRSSLRSRRSADQQEPETPPAASADVAPTVLDEPFVVTDAQRRYFDTFGFVAFRGLFAPDIERLTEGFEEVFAAEEGRTFDTQVALHFDQKRSIIPAFIDKSDKLSWLHDDDRVATVVRSLIGEAYDYSESDGNLFYCDSSWHPDNYASPMTQYHVKLSFYLDPLHGENGAIRMMPGTNDWTSSYATAVRQHVDDPQAIETLFGVPPQDLPSFTIESEPGDLIVWNFRTVHAAFNSGQRRRLFSVNFREKFAPTA